MVRKSLHLTNAWHPASGGIRTFYLALMEAANQRGHQMRMVVPSDSTRVEQVGEHCKIYHLKAPRAPINPAYRVLYPHHYLFHGGVIRRILNDERPDVIEICDKYCFPYLGGLLRVGRLPGVDFRPTVVNLSCERFTDNLSAYASSGLLARLFAQWYLRWVYFPMADHHIAVSPYIAEELQTVAEGHKVDRGVWIGPMGVDYANFAAARPDAALRACLCPDAAPNTRLLVYAARLAKEKNLSLLLDTLAELRQDAAIDYRLLIIGDGKLREWLQAESKRRTPGAVRFHGHIDSRQHLASIYAN